MDATTIFEITPVEGGFRPSATMSWGGNRSGASGTLCFEVFESAEAEQRWCAVQFSIPAEAWQIGGGRLRAVRVINAGGGDWQSVEGASA